MTVLEVSDLELLIMNRWELKYSSPSEIVAGVWGKASLSDFFPISFITSENYIHRVPMWICIYSSLFKDMREWSLYIILLSGVYSLQLTVLILKWLILTLMIREGKNVYFKWLNSNMPLFFLTKDSPNLCK